MRYAFPFANLMSLGLRTQGSDFPELVPWSLRRRTSRFTFLVDAVSHLHFAAQC
jgi:hypothetical protein